MEKIALECQNTIREVLGEGFPLNAIVVDYTSGTKAMSAGLTVAAIREKVGILTYTTGKRGDEGRVISGTERVLSLARNQIFAGDLFREAVESFNTYHFDVALKILADVRVLLSDPDFLKQARLLELLCHAYSAWDRFEVEKAFEHLRTLPEEMMLKEWRIDRQIRLNKQALYQEKENLFCAERALDLIENARRRGDEENKYDDGVARLYRTCEYLGQLEINRKGFYRIKDGKPDTSDLDLSSLSADLQQKYSRYKSLDDGKVKVPLSGNYELLGDLDHPAGLFFKREQKQFKKLMGLRDLSILAHGFNPVSEATYKAMLKLLEEFLATAGLGDARETEKVRFPKIDVAHARSR